MRGTDLLRYGPVVPVLALLSLAASAPSAGNTQPRLSEAQAFSGPFDSLRGCVAVTASDLRRLDEGHVVTHVLPGADREVSVFAARRVAAGGNRLLQWVAAIDQLKRSPAVHAISRLSDPPHPQDVADLTLTQSEVAALTRCRSGDCAFKLTADERSRIHQAGAAGAADAFRRVLLRRVEAYQHGGLGALGHYDDGRTPHALEESARALTARLPCLAHHLPDLARVLDQEPRPSPPPSLSFFYWSKEEFRDRPVVLLTRVVAVQRRVAGRAETVVAGRNIYAAHYLNAGLNLTGVVEMPDGRHYLFVLNRTSVDVIGGMFGGLVRGMVERRLRSDVSTVIDQVGRRLEGGEPVATVPER